MAPNHSSDKTCVWTTTDFADFDEPGVAKVESFAVKFASPACKLVKSLEILISVVSSVAETFRATFDKYKVENGPGRNYMFVGNYSQFDIV
jgi:hypothetical protein